MDKKDQIILQQLDVIRSMTENNMKRMNSDFWGTPFQDVGKAPAAPGKPAEPEKPVPPTADAKPGDAAPEKAEELPPPEKIEDLLAELDTYIGLNVVKDEVHDLINMVQVYKLREQHDLPTTDMSLHMVFTGNPGTGKTMLASRIPGVMSPLSESEQLEVASIRSLCGTLPSYGISDVPPFEAPHHTASTASLVGGGAGLAQPGAITRAHRGILFMDEAPEFSARTLQTLREPLESGYVAISRAKGTTYYPARFQLIMAANPCPCGYAYGNGERCTCREKDRIKYFSRLSGPILDRIDIQIEVPPVERINPGTVPSGESSHAIRLRVMVARQTAQERFREFGWVCNAQATGTWLRANTSTKAIELVNHALASERLSLRGADRAMRLAWTLSDLSGKTSPGPEEMMQGISMRTRLT